MTVFGMADKGASPNIRCLAVGTEADALAKGARHVG